MSIPSRRSFRRGRISAGSCSGTGRAGRTPGASATSMRVAAHSHRPVAAEARQDRQRCQREQSCPRRSRGRSAGRRHRGALSAIKRPSATEWAGRASCVGPELLRRSSVDGDRCRRRKKEQKLQVAPAGHACTPVSLTDASGTLLDCLAIVDERKRSIAALPTHAPDRTFAPAVLSAAAELRLCLRLGS